MNRGEILEESMKCVCEDRERQYGKPRNNFRTIADMWEAYLAARLGLEAGNVVIIDEADVALMLALMKIGRIATAPGNLPRTDSFVDLAGYAALAGEMVTDPPDEADERETE